MKAPHMMLLYTAEGLLQLKQPRKTKLKTYLLIVFL